MREKITAILKPLRIEGMDASLELYAMLDRPQWQKERFSLVMNAKEVLEEALPPGVKVEADTTSGEMWAERLQGPGQVGVCLLVGKYDKARASFEWRDAQLIELGWDPVVARDRFSLLCNF